MGSELRIVHELEHPRVLVMGSAGFVKKVQDSGFSQTQGSWRVISSLTEVDSAEWDCLITDKGVGAVEFDQELIAKRPLAGSVSVFHVFNHQDTVMVDVHGDGQEWSLLAVETGVPGTQIRQSVHLPNCVEPGLIAQALAVIKNRDKHVGLVVGTTDEVLQEHRIELRPFLVGPGNLALAGIYKRQELDHWFIPADFPDLGLWLTAAFTAWSEARPERFPGSPAWQADPLWQLPQERKLSDEQRIADEAHMAYQAQYEEDSRRRQEEAHQLANKVDEAERLLLTGQGEALEEQVSLVFWSLGFVVEAMDTPETEKARKEDFRLSLADDSEGWLCLVEVSGTKGGVTQTKLGKFNNHVERYLAHRTDGRPFNKWLVVNQHLGKDPRSRYPVFHSEVRDVFADGGGLVIETPALFLLLSAYRAEPALQEKIRDHLIGLTGTFDIRAAAVLLSSFSGKSGPYKNHEFETLFTAAEQETL